MMDLRKVQLTGGSSITVTLPKPWVERSKIRAGDVIGCLEQADGSLSIYPHTQKGREVQSYEIEVEETEQQALFRKIIAAYLMGYNVIKLTSKRPMTTEVRQTIRTAVRRIVGLEIVEEQPNAIAVQDFLNPRDFHIEKAVRRMAILTRAMQEEAIASLRDPKPEVLRSEEDRDSEVDRLYWLVNKQYHAILRDSSYASKLGLSSTQALNFLLAARLLERTADHADRIAQEAIALPKGRVQAAFLDRLERQARRASEIFQEALETFIRREIRKANAVIEEAKRLQESQKKLLREATEFGGETIVHLAYIIESIGRTAAYAADLGEVAINHAVATA